VKYGSGGKMSQTFSKSQKWVYDNVHESSPLLRGGKNIYTSTIAINQPLTGKKRRKKYMNLIVAPCIS